MVPLCRFYMHVAWDLKNKIVLFFHFSLLSTWDSDDSITTSKVLSNVCLFHCPPFVFHVQTCGCLREALLLWLFFIWAGTVCECADKVAELGQLWNFSQISFRTVPWRHYCIYCYYSNWTDLQEVALNPSAVQCLDWGNGQVSERGEKASVKMKTFNK